MTAFGPAPVGPVGRIHWAGTETADVWAGARRRSPSEQTGHSGEKPA